MLDELLAETERIAVEALKTSDDFHVGCEIYRLVLSSLARGVSPEAVCKGLEATVRAIRTASTEKQLSEMMLPGVQ